MDGDSAAKTMDKGATSAMQDTEFTSGMHETAKERKEPMGEKTQGTGTPVFSKDGAIGSAFTSTGAIGGTAQAIGGPFDSAGAIGKHFTAEGSVGGAVQERLGQGEEGTYRQ